MGQAPETQSSPGAYSCKMATDMVPLRKAKQGAPVLLMASIGAMALTQPIVALLAVAGVAASSLAKVSDKSYPETKRRTLAGLWEHFGGYTLFMGILCALVMGVGLVLTHSLWWGAILLFTLAACWVPFVVALARKRGH